MKSKFANLNFEGVEVLSKEETKKVKGGYLPSVGQFNPAGGLVNYTIQCSGQVQLTNGQFSSYNWLAPVVQGTCYSFQIRQQACINALPPNVAILNTSTLAVGNC